MAVKQNEMHDAQVSSPRVIKTFLFTDIVKSTDIRDTCIREFGDKGNKIYDDEVLTPHDEILNRLIARFQGKVISTAGDSYFCSFDYARDAILCAVIIQREFIERKIPPPVAESNLSPYIQIRIGLHHGGASEVLRAGQPNLSDHTVNIAARIEGCANGEQVLMSEETWNNAGRLEDITKQEWTGYRLKGVGGQWTLVEALWDGRKPHPPGMSLADLVFEIFAGRVEILTDDLLSHLADPKRVQQFYAGASLDWDIIAAHGDIPRDQQEELNKQAREPFEGMRFICVVAEAGAGKSTLAWRVAAELHQQYKALIIRIKDSDDGDVWYRLPEFCTKVDRPFYVLVDDVFHDPDAASAFRELNPWLPITILATSRHNEYRAQRFKCETLRMNLKPPDLYEKERILRRLGKSYGDLTADQQRRLDAANQFIVLMMELTAGKELHDIVRDSIERLRELDEPAYRASEYLCLAYQHSIAMPVSLLERLDAQGRFHNLPERDTAQGLIFWDSREGLVRAGHPVIAQTVAEFYAQHHSPQAVLTEIAAIVNMADVVERRFFGILMRALAKAKSSILSSLPEPLESAITHSIQSTNHISDLVCWREFYNYRGQNDDAKKCVDLALRLEPISQLDCSLLLNLWRKHGNESNALPAIAKWVKDHPEQGGARVAYLGLVERYAPNNVEMVLQETSAWLATHPDDNYVRGRYLGLVERKGTPEQVAQVVQETSAWLATHPDDNSVRGRYLGLVERKGTPKQVAQVVSEIRGWLALHPHNIEVRKTYLGLVERKGTLEHVAQVVQETSVWLAKHPQDANVRSAYLGLVGRKGTPEQVAQVIKEISAWLAEHPQDVNVRQAWLSFVEAYGSDDLKEVTIADMRVWLVKHPSAKEVWNALLGWLFRSGQADEATALTLAAISHHPKDQNLLIHYLRALQGSEDEKKVRSVYESLIATYPRNRAIQGSYAAWLRDHGCYDEAEWRYKTLIDEAPRNYHTHYNYGVLLLKSERFDEAATQFCEVLNIHKGHQMAHDGLAWALWKTGDFRQAEREFHSAIYWAGIQGQPQAKFYTDLGWFYLDRERWREALQAFASARDEDPDYFGNYWGIGRSLKELGDYAAASNALRSALEKAPPDLEPPASEEIPELLRQCINRLGDDGFI